MSFVRALYRLIIVRPTEAERRCWRSLKSVALTFDDEADPVQVTAILDVLRRNNVRAGFFPIGKWANAHPALISQIVYDGHWLGSHTYNHRRLRWASTSTIVSEVQREPLGRLVRPPYGDYGGRVRRILKRHGMKVAYWTVDSRDWTGITPAEMVTNVLDGLDVDGVVLLHLNGPHTLEALPQLISEIRGCGLILEPLTA